MKDQKEKQKMIKKESGSQRKGDHVGNVVVWIIGKKTVQQKRTEEAMKVTYLESWAQVQIL